MPESTTSKAVLDKDGNPAATAIQTRPATLDLGRLDLLDPESPNEATLRALEQRALFRENIVKFALRQTSPRQYVIHRAEGDETRESVYPMGAAVDAMFGFLGLTWAVVVVNNEDGSHRRGETKFSASIQTDSAENRYWWVESGLWLRDQLVGMFEGKRKIGSGYAKNELDAKIDAFENLKSRAGRQVLGLSAKSRADYKAMGLDLSEARVAEFQDHKANLSSDPTAAVIPFGNETKGKKVCDVDDGQLAWVLGAIEKSLADPKKANFKRGNEALRDAIKAEQAKRAAAPTISAEEKDEYEKTIAMFMEEGAALGIAEEKLKGYVQGFATLAQAKKGLENYRERRKKKAAPAPEPGSDG
jgi:hypothetical protein